MGCSTNTSASQEKGLLFSSRLRPRYRVRLRWIKVAKDRCSLSAQEATPPQSSRVPRTPSPRSRPRYRGPAPSLRGLGPLHLVLERGTLSSANRDLQYLQPLLFLQRAARAKVSANRKSLMTGRSS